MMPLLASCLALPPSLVGRTSTASVGVGVAGTGLGNNGGTMVSFDNVTFVAE